MANNVDPIEQARLEKQHAEAEAAMLKPMGEAIMRLLQGYGPSIGINAPLLAAVVRAKHQGVTADQWQQAVSQLWANVDVTAQGPVS